MRAHVEKVDVLGWTKSITNVVLTSTWGIAVFWTRSRSDSIVTKMIDTKYKNNIGGTSPPSNHSFLI